jgi:hypothetical protein
MSSKKVCPFGEKWDNSLYHKELDKSVPTVPRCALIRMSKIIPYAITSYNKVCPCAPHSGGRKGGKQ